MDNSVIYVQDNFDIFVLFLQTFTLYAAAKQTFQVFHCLGHFNEIVCKLHKNLLIL